MAVPTLRPGEPQIQRSLPGSDHGERHRGCDLLLSAFSPGEGLLRGLGQKVGQILTDDRDALLNAFENSMCVNH